MTNAAMVGNEKKKFQNKLSQRKHRAKQQSKLNELETKVEVLTRKLYNCIHKNKSRDELRAIQDESNKRINKIYQDVADLKTFLDTELFGNIDKISEDVEDDDLLVTPPSLETEDLFKTLDQATTTLDDGIEQIYPNTQLVPTTTTTINNSHINNNNKALVTSPTVQNTTYYDQSGLLRNYLYSSKLHYLSVLSGHLYNSEIVINDISTQFIASIDKLESQNQLANAEQLLSSPTILNMVCQYANEILEKIPRVKNYTFALCGVKWICGQILLLCLTRPGYESLASAILFDQNNAFYRKLYQDLQNYLKSWMDANRFNKLIELLIETNLKTGNKNELIDMNNYSLILHQYFVPTNLQFYLLKKDPSTYPYWINFVIWPEFRDTILTNLESISPEIRTTLTNELLDKVVLVIYAENETETDLIFHMAELETIINFTIDCINEGLDHDDENLIKPSMSRLRRNGLFNPGCWRMAKSFGIKFKNIVPTNLVVWDIDDTDPANIAKPFYNPLIQ